MSGLLTAFLGLILGTMITEAPVRSLLGIAALVLLTVVM